MTYGISNAAVGENRDIYLKLLTVQLKNQSPLDPIDTNSFMQQLVQFTSVEQQLQSNEKLADLVKLGQQNIHAISLGFIGADIVASGQWAELKNGRAAWNYQASQNGVASRMVVRDAQGQVVYSAPVSLSAGKSSVFWNGKTNDGYPAPGGIYQLSLLGRDANGKTVEVSTKISGKVDGIDFSKSEPMLQIGDQVVPLFTVTSLKK